MNLYLFFTKRKKGYRTPIKIIRWTTPVLGKVIVIVRNSYFGYYRQCYTNNKYLDGTDTTLFLHPSFFYFCFNNFLFLFKYLFLFDQAYQLGVDRYRKVNRENNCKAYWVYLKPNLVDITYENHKISFSIIGWSVSCKLVFLNL